MDSSPAGQDQHPVAGKLLFLVVLATSIEARTKIEKSPGSTHPSSPAQEKQQTTFSFGKEKEKDDALEPERAPLPPIG